MKDTWSVFSSYYSHSFLQELLKYLHSFGFWLGNPGRFCFCLPNICFPSLGENLFPSPLSCQNLWFVLIMEMGEVSCVTGKSYKAPFILYVLSSLCIMINDALYRRCLGRLCPRDKKSQSPPTVAHSKWEKAIFVVNHHSWAGRGVVTAVWPHLPWLIYLS